MAIFVHTPNQKPRTFDKLIADKLAEETRNRII